jgi:hypothetical protein
MAITHLAILSARVAALTGLALCVAGPAAAGMCFDVHLRFSDRAPSRALVESMTREASSIWQLYDIRVQWSTSDARGSTRDAPRCAAANGSFEVFVHRRGTSRTTALNRVLGTTQVAPAAIDHVPVRIDQGATEGLLESLPAEDLAHLVGRPFPAPADVGRALGRVLAHEMGHVILAAVRHQPRGLMRQTFFAADLVRYERELFTLSEAEVTRLCERALDLDDERNLRGVPSLSHQEP